MQEPPREPNNVVKFTVGEAADVASRVSDNVKDQVANHVGERANELSKAITARQIGLLAIVFFSVGWLILAVRVRPSGNTDSGDSSPQDTPRAESSPAPSNEQTREKECRLRRESNKPNVSAMAVDSTEALSRVLREDDQSYPAVLNFNKSGSRISFEQTSCTVEISLYLQKDETPPKELKEELDRLVRRSVKETYEESVEIDFIEIQPES